MSNYKRFNDLTISEIPKGAKLVVLVGPNGSGKSSVFDALLLKSWSAQTNLPLRRGLDNYYLKTLDVEHAPTTTREIANRVSVELHCHEDHSPDWARLLRIRSAYRNDPDFQLDSLSRPPDPASHSRFERIIDTDQSVSENYSRLAWQRMADLDQNAAGDVTFAQYRAESLARLRAAITTLFSDPPLRLQDFGGISSAGTFRFAKGSTSDFHYKNLSAGEKAAFDVLLDMFIATSEFPNLIYCIDEPEAHLAPAIQRLFLRSMLEMLPETSQLWIATHAAGFVTEAKQSMAEKKQRCFPGL